VRDELDLPVVDHHCHLSPTGEGVAAARRFRKAGGTHLFLTTMALDGKVPMSVEDYAAQYESTARLARRIETDAGVSVRCVVAPYPVDLLTQAERLGLRAATEVQCAALDLAGHWVEDQQAVALGEVGRPHFAVAPELASAAMEVFRHALEVARDADCPAVVHSEDLSADGFRDLAGFAAQCSFPLGRLVKHFTRTFVPVEDRHGIVPSFVARRELAKESLASPAPWFWETDFLDDPKRPGAVLDLATIPRRAREALAADPKAVDQLRIPFQRSVQSVYGFLPEASDARNP
jgi:TatD-related deoxyribonuclease